MEEKRAGLFENGLMLFLAGVIGGKVRKRQWRL